MEAKQTNTIGQNATQCPPKYAHHNSNVVKAALRTSPPQPIKNIPPPNLPLRTPSRQRTRTINKPTPIHPQHAHLNHRRHKRRVPRPFARRKGIKRNRRDRIRSDVLIRLHGKRRFPVLRFIVILVIPGADCGIEGGAGRGGIGEALLGCGVCADEGGEIYGGEAFGC
jgi:hypothetical protein